MSKTKSTQYDVAEYRRTPEEAAAYLKTCLEERDRPHVVILGAGCSRAALPEGDANGVQLPLMHDFLKIVAPLKDLFASIGIKTDGRNLEEIYSDLVGSCASEIVREAESTIYQYFESLVLPDRPTLYDHLLLGLRGKDVVATFNWDPFLVQAFRRNKILHDHGPQLIFLHGNVMAAFCAKHSIQGPHGNPCSKCGELLRKSKLLYPIKEKNYDDDPMISASWNQLRSDLKHSFMVTIFGYGAPDSDRAAIDLLKEGLGDPYGKLFNQIEIIDIKPREELYDVWEPLIQIHNHHYKIHPSFYDSWIARHPRRTQEAFVQQYLKGEWISDDRIPANLEFTDLWKWAESLIEKE